MPNLLRAAQDLAAALPRVQDWGSSVLLLGMRVAVGRVFFLSGLVKVSDWDATQFLFQTDYRLPLPPPGIAAPLSASFELGMPVLLVLGLCARLAALPLVGMTLVIHFVLGGINPACRTPDHFFWLLLLLAIVVQGPGRLALDEILWPFLLRRRSPGPA
ncbi:MAG: DoxX family protein [Acetobacteraceae bacterium]|nr:DoxX family protein [Acetobacteraceae bacterium]